MVGWRFEHTYATLPSLLHSRVAPTPVPDPEVVIVNVGLAAELGLDAEALGSAEGAAILAGNLVPEGAEPLAQAYAGHQFGFFTGLGDGRAILLGEHVAPDGRRVDIQLKGSGQTPYSRRGDGRAALGPMLREFVIGEAMHALGVPTSRSLAVASTGELVHRERAFPGAVLTRVAASHLRVGTFQWAAAHQDVEAVRALVDYTIGRHYPDTAGTETPALALLDAIVDRQARLIAAWQLVGFIHGVMNTDNMSLAGETLDYGPCAFMDVYDPATVFSSIDLQGRYAYRNQPGMAQWNLTRLAETMLPLLASDHDRAVELATASLQRFDTGFEEAWRAGLRAKLGLFTVEAGDDTLADDLLAWMQRTGADFTRTFSRLSEPGGPEALADGDGAFADWLVRWRVRLERQSRAADDVMALMQGRNPAVIARNHAVERALAAAGSGDLDPFRNLLDRLTTPYDYSRMTPDLAEPPPDGNPGYRTFCGT